MMRATNAATITVVATGEQFNTLDDWGLAIGNNNYISAPDYESYLVDVPGRTGYLDLTESITGRTIYKSRSISIKLGGLRAREDWDKVISTFRNKIHGQIIKLTFDNDLSHYWKGRAELEDFDRTRQLGTFKLNIPKADPYKYEMYSSVEEWIWDSFDFEYDTIRYIGTVEVDKFLEIDILEGGMLTVPVFTVEEIIDYLTLEIDQTIYTLSEGQNRFPSILVCGNDIKPLYFRGHGKVTIDYRGGSL